MSEAARPGTSDDLEIIAALGEQGAAEKRDQRGGEMFLAREAGGPAEERAAALLAADDGVVVVGTYDDVVFGYALGEVEDLGDRRQLRVDDLYVDPEIRESGVGEMVMDLLVAEAGQRGCTGIGSRALPGDRETKNFFESFGLKARMLVVHRDLTT